MNRRIVSTVISAAVVAALAGGTVAASNAQAAAPPAAVADLSAAVPSWVHDRAHTAVPGTERVDFVVQLASTDAAALHAFAAQVSDPASPSYQHFLTPAQYTATFAPSREAVTTVRTALAAAGISVDQVTGQGTFLRVHAPAATVASAFDTSFGRFAVDGLQLRAPLTVPVLPTALRGLVSNVAGLAESAPLKPAADPGPVFLNARPCSTPFYGEKTATDQPTYQGAPQPYAICGYTPSQLRSAYDLDKTGELGAGASVGIVDAFASPTILADANKYATSHGDAVFADGQFTDAVPGISEIPEDPTGLLLDPQGWAGEETLDVEAVHGMAPQADIHYYSGVTPLGPMLYVALAQAVESGDVQVVSNSYGTASDSPMAPDKFLFDAITDEAATLGVTIAYSSGDSGDETDPSAAGARTADFPATSTGVTAVGGTSLHINAAGQRTGETYWGTLKDPKIGVDAASTWDFVNKVYSGAGGGGVSTSYAEPAWQKGVVPDNLTTIGGLTTAGRVEPDVSLDADSTTGMLVGQTQTFKDGTVGYSEYRIGGTSQSCPLFAGLVAQAVGRRKGVGVGLVNPTMYAASKTTAGITKYFYDPQDVPVDKVTGQSTVANVRPDYTDTTDPSTAVLYSLRTLGNLATLHRYVGYDDSTGLGSPNGPALVDLLAPPGGTTPTPTPTPTPTTSPTTSPTSTPTTTPTTSPAPVGAPERTKTRIRLPHPVVVHGAKARLLFQVTGLVASTGVVGSVRVSIDGKTYRTYNTAITLKSGKQVRGFSITLPRSLKVKAHKVLVTFTPSSSSAYTSSSSRKIKLTVVSPRSRS